MNADDPEAVVDACRMAADWRNRFHKDVVVDLVGYRRRASHHATSTLFVLLNHVPGSLPMPCRTKACH